MNGITEARKSGIADGREWAQMQGKSADRAIPRDPVTDSKLQAKGARRRLASLVIRDEKSARRKRKKAAPDLPKLPSPPPPPLPPPHASPSPGGLPSQVPAPRPRRRLASVSGLLAGLLTRTPVTAAELAPAAAAAAAAEELAQFFTHPLPLRPAGGAQWLQPAQQQPPSSPFGASLPGPLEDGPFQRRPELRLQLPSRWESSSGGDTPSRQHDEANRGAIGTVAHRWPSQPPPGATHAQTGRGLGGMGDPPIACERLHTGAPGCVRVPLPAPRPRNLGSTHKLLADKAHALPVRPATLSLSVPLLIEADATSSQLAPARRARTSDIRRRRASPLPLDQDELSVLRCPPTFCRLLVEPVSSTGYHDR
ncbi:hypothetical protein ACCO45_002885 [Purpureocillium lilacinum]|uniref:Uncharacterized protein n=1 Tax=Purpureocillium lilacinum TaxID=33203 RepID=A0ACC4DZ72_PURLI